MIFKLYAKFVNERSIALLKRRFVRVVCLFALITMLLRLNEYPVTVNEQQKVY